VRRGIRDPRIWGPFLLALAALPLNVALTGVGLGELGTLVIFAGFVLLGIGFVEIAPWGAIGISVTWFLPERLVVWVIRGVGVILVLIGAWLGVAWVYWKAVGLL
jgi:hypothetical protein